jgi:Tfp pilus assembly protein PilN
MRRRPMVVAPRRMGRPGLMGTMARTAVVAGTASAVAGGVSRRSSQRADEQEQYAALQQQQMAAQQQAAPPAAAQDDTMAKIKELGEMKSQGLLTDEEFAVQKSRILGM